jgi:putative addiction module killer protein
MQQPEPRQLELYVTDGGKAPFTDWLEALRDKRGRAQIESRLDRVQLGNLGDCRSVGSGVYELRIDVGPGYRVYFAEVDNTIVLLLCGGDKGTQTSDIARAKEYWEDYQERTS